MFLLRRRKSRKSRQIPRPITFSFTQDEIHKRRLSQTTQHRNHSDNVDDVSEYTLSVFKYSLPGDIPSNTGIARIELQILGGFDPFTKDQRKECQDDCDYAMLEAPEEGTTKDAVFCLFDGHGSNGRKISHFCTDKYLETLLRNGISTKRDPATVLETTMLHLHAQLKDCPEIDMTFSGTTAILSLIRDGKLYVANVGDSRAVIVSEMENGDLKAKPLTEDHKVGNADEKKRILKRGGRVERLVDENGVDCGPERAWLQTENTPGIAMSRSLGDAVAHTIGVISNADVQIHEISSNDKYFIMASDGVWEVFTNDALAVFLEIVLAEGLKPGESLANKVCSEALNRWNILLAEEDTLVDDISAVVCTFSEMEEEEEEREDDEEE